MSTFSKAFNKANQFMSEKIGGVEPTKISGDLGELKQKTTAINNMVDDLLNKTKEYLQPNPVQRAQMAASKLSKSKSTTPPVQPEGVLAESLFKHGNDLGNDLVLGKTLVKMAESLKVIAEEKNALDTSVKQEFLDPFTRFQNNDLKDINYYRKKLHDARVDYDYKRRKLEKGGNHANREEVKLAEDKLEEFINFTHMRMHNLLNNEVEQVTQLSIFVNLLQDYHKHCAEILQHLKDDMNDFKIEADSKPKPAYETYKLEDIGINRIGESSGPSSSAAQTREQTTNKPIPPKVPASPKPSLEKRCKALYDFDAENDGELSFREGDEITIIKQVDENWCEGKLFGVTGFFPANYVQM